MLLQRLFVFDGLIQGPVKAILGRNGILGAQHHVHGRRPIPALMNAQFALRITKPVDRQKFNYLGPLHRPVPILECCAKKLIELQLLPQPATQPAAPKLPRPTYRQAREDHFANVGSLRRSRSFTVGKEPILSTLTFLLNHFDRAVPALDPGGVQLPKVEYSVLRRPSSTEPNTPAITRSKFGGGSIGILTYISEATTVLCYLSQERLCSVRRAMTSHRTYSEQNLER